MDIKDLIDAEIIIKGEAYKIKSISVDDEFIHLDVEETGKER